MSWAQWPVNQTGLSLPSVINSAPPVLNPSVPAASAGASTLIPGAQYTPEQWAQMQQQNWQQWAQWQQQYQQWHQQYGAEYQKSLNAMNPQTNQPPLPSLPNMAVPPPLPNDPKGKPPLPPDEPPSSVGTHNNYSAPIPTSAGNDKQQDFGNPDKNRQNWNQNKSWSGPSTVGGNFPKSTQFGKRSFNDAPFGDVKRSRFDQPDRWAQGRNWDNKPGGSYTEAPPNTANPPPASHTENNEELSETEKKFIKQFADWEAQFNKWKEQNANHPDKEQYKEYEKKWETWRKQLLERREQMRRKRLGLTGSDSAKSNIDAPKTSFNIHTPDRKPLLPTPSSDMNKPLSSMKSDFDDQKIDFKQDIPSEDNSEGFLKSTNVKSEGIPGLDLVKEDTDEEEEEKPQNSSPDFEAISKGINSILGDEKILSMLSKVSKQQFGYQPNQPEEPKLSSSRSNESFNACSNDKSFGAEDYNQPNYPKQQDTIGNIDEQTRSSFGGHYDFNNQQAANRNQGNYQQKNFESFRQPANFRNEPMRGSFGQDNPNQDKFRENYNRDNYGKPAFNRNSDNLNRNSDNFNRNSDNFNRNSDNFNRNSDHFNRPPYDPPFNRNSGPRDNFDRPNDNANINKDMPGDFNKSTGKFSRTFDDYNEEDDLNNDPFAYEREDYEDAPYNRGPNDSGRNFAGNFNKMPPGNFGNRNANIGPFDPNFQNNRGRGFGNTPNFNRGNNFNQPGGADLNRDQGYNRDSNFNAGPDFNQGRGEFGRGGPELNRGNPDFNREGPFGFNRAGPGNFGNRSDLPPNFNEPRDNFSVPPPNQTEETDKTKPQEQMNKNAPAEPQLEAFWKPEKIIDYDHKSLNKDDFEVSIEPVQTFDYRHKPVNRIPYPDRPTWVAKILGQFPEFSPVIGRGFDRHSTPQDTYDTWRSSRDSYSSHRRYDDRRKEDRYPYSRNDEDRRFREGDRYSDRKYEEKSYDKKYDDRRHSESKRSEDRRSSERERKSRHEKNDESYDRNRRHSNERRYSGSRFEDTKHNSDRAFAEKQPVKFDEGRTMEVVNKELEKSFSKPPQKQNVTLVEDLLSPPGRFNRPARIVIILRGPPGSGKTFLARLIKDKEVENGGSPPRILSLDDYFIVEQEKEIMEDGKKVKVKEMVYEYEEEMEASYRTSLFKSFKKTITDGYFPFIIVDNINDKVKYFGEMWSFAKQNGFQVYICQMELDLQSCTRRNIHGRTEAEIDRCIKGWEPTPNHHPILDATSLLQAGSIPDVEMEEINSPASDDIDEGHDEEVATKSKWDTFDCSFQALAKLDGVSKPLRASKTMDEYLKLDNEWVATTPIKPGQKRVRWADLEERKEQEKMRAIGFVVGQTNWDRMMDPSMGSSALTQTKYIERVGKYQSH